MPRSLLSQLLQVNASSTYDDAVSSPHTVGVAEGQGSLEGDMNVFRTLMKDLKGTTNWYDDTNLSVKEIYEKYFVQLYASTSFENVAVNGGSTTAFDTAIQTISSHNDGGGNSTTSGVVTNTTLPHRISLRDSATQDPIEDGSNNEVYGRLTWNGTAYVVTFYSNVSGTETAYTFGASTNVDLAYVAVSRRYEELSWDRFLDFEFHDVAGLSGTILDDNVTVNGMSFLLNGLTTQAAVNDKLDKLGSTANGEGASGVAIEDASAWYTSDDVEGALNEVETLLGSTTSTTYDFSEENVLADNDAVYPALEKLDLKWGDLSSNTNGEGASIVGIEDSGSYFTATNVEGALQEIGGLIENVSGWEKEVETPGSPISSGTNHTIPGSKTYTPNSGANMDVYVSGQLLVEGTGNDYEEVSSTQIKFLFTVPSSKNITYMIRA
jgi:hypothetical protein